LKVPTEPSDTSNNSFDDFGGDDFGDDDFSNDDFGDDDFGDDSGSDNPFGDDKFDAGTETNEEDDPKKFIEQLSGKIGQSLRDYTDSEGSPDFDLEKFVVNSVLSATHTAEMEESDRQDIINKVETSGEGEGDDENSDDDDSKGNENTEDDDNTNDDDFGGMDEDILAEFGNDYHYDDREDNRDAWKTSGSENSYGENSYGKNIKRGLKWAGEKVKNGIQHTKDIATGNAFTKNPTEWIDETGEEVKKLTNKLGDLVDTQKNRIFDENNNMIEEILDTMFNGSEETTPVKEPSTKPGTKTTPTEPVGPSRRNKPFSPGKKIYTNPQPKAKL